MKILTKYIENKHKTQHKSCAHLSRRSSVLAPMPPELTPSRHSERLTEHPTWACRSSPYPAHRGVGSDTVMMVLIMVMMVVVVVMMVVMVVVMMVVVMMVVMMVVVKWWW